MSEDRINWREILEMTMLNRRHRDTFPDGFVDDAMKAMERLAAPQETELVIDFLERFISEHAVRKTPEERDRSIRESQCSIREHRAAEVPA